jgi:hypothetical protein
MNLCMYIDVINSPKIDSLMELNKLTNLTKILIKRNFCMNLQYILKTQWDHQ